MKLIKSLFIYSLIAALAISCEKGLDPIVPVPAKPDVYGPDLVINYPVEGKPFVSPDEVATIIFKLVATDDIELKSVSLQLDGAEIGFLNNFKDYRRADIAFEYSNMTDGDHTLTVIVADLTDKSITKSVNFNKITAPLYTPLDGEVLYLPLDGYLLDLISGNALTVVGSPGFATGKVGDAYAGAQNAYLEYPATGLLGSEFSLSFWYKINAMPLRGGIMAISPVGESRNSGFRFLRENAGDNQNLGINFGIGEAEVWMNPFITVPTNEDWMHIAISISETMAIIYVNGEVQKETEITAKIDWTGCTSISIASGAPNFTYWEHFSDLSLYDEIHLFKRAITAAEVLGFYESK
jgi:hypothetical protein